MADDDILTIGNLRKLLDDPGLDDDAPVFISDYDDQHDVWERLPVSAAEVRRGFNAPACLVLAWGDPEKALG